MYIETDESREKKTPTSSRSCYLDPRYPPAYTHAIFIRVGLVPDLGFPMPFSQQYISYPFQLVIPRAIWTSHGHDRRLARLSIYLSIYLFLGVIAARRWVRGRRRGISCRLPEEPCLHFVRMDVRAGVADCGDSGWEGRDRRRCFLLLPFLRHIHNSHERGWGGMEWSMGG